MDIFNAFGNVCSVIGLAFAIVVYIKSKNKKK